VKNPAPPARPSAAEAIEATAAAWLAQRDDALSPEDTKKFAAWRAADPRHEAAAARLERAWAALQPLRDFRPAAACHPDRDLLAARAARRAPRWPALAAAAGLALAASAWFALRPAAPPAAEIHATTADGYERVTLADGSVAELNSASEIAVRYTAGERRVRLARGEAHFTVAKNPARPFVVEAAGVAVRAVGTAFNVRLGAAEVEVLVTEGRVAVAEVERVDPNAPLTAAPLDPARWGQRAPPTGTLLSAHERTVIATAAATAAPLVEKVSPSALREALAWQGPRLVFADTPLAEAIAQFNRRNPVQLALAEGDPALAALPIGGSFRAESVEAFVRLLVSGGDLVAERPDSARIVLRRAR
jgi:transmembrane sensor